MDNVSNVGLNVLLHCVLQLVGVLTLGTRPRCLALHWVKAGDKKETDLSLQLLVMRSSLPRSSWCFHHRVRHLLELDLHQVVWRHHWTLALPLLRLLLVLPRRLRGVRPHDVSSQGVPRLGRLFALWTLVGKARDVGLNVLLHCVPDLGGKLALSTLPDCLAHDWVVGGDKKLLHLLVKLLGVGNVLFSRGQTPGVGHVHLGARHLQVHLGLSSSEPLHRFTVACLQFLIFVTCCLFVCLLVCLQRSGSWPDGGGGEDKRGAV